MPDDRSSDFFSKAAIEKRRLEREARQRLRETDIRTVGRRAANRRITQQIAERKQVLPNLELSPYGATGVSVEESAHPIRYRMSDMLTSPGDPDRAELKRLRELREDRGTWHWEDENYFKKRREGIVEEAKTRARAVFGKGGKRPNINLMKPKMILRATKYLQEREIPFAPILKKQWGIVKPVVKIAAKPVAKAIAPVGAALDIHDVYRGLKEFRKAGQAGREAHAARYYAHKNYGTVERATKTRKMFRSNQ